MLPEDERISNVLLPFHATPLGRENREPRAEQGATFSIMLADKIRIATRVHSPGRGDPGCSLIIERSARFRGRGRCRPLLSRSVSIRIVICCCHASWTSLEIYCVSIIPASGFIVHRLVVIVRHRDTISDLSALFVWLLEQSFAL